MSRRDGAPEPAQILRLRQAGSTRGPAEPSPDGADANAGATAHSEGSSADLFALLWKGLSDILGTAAAATLLRRAAQCALPRVPELAALSIARPSLEYEYTLPASWSSPGPAPCEALRALARELWPLLVDLTGSVVIHRLEQVPELRALAVALHEESQP